MGSNFSKDGCFHSPTMDERNLDSRRKYLRNYNPPESSRGYVNILLFGIVGTGKSSTINTFLSALDPEGRTINMVPTGDNKESLSEELKSYTAAKLKFWDTAGWNAIHPDQTKRLDWKQKKTVFQMILEGRVPSKTNLKEFDPFSDGSNYPVIPENVIHGVAFLFDLHTIDNISDDKMEEFHELETIVARKYILRVVIGTKFELLGMPEKNNAWIYEYKPLNEKFDELAQRSGMERRSMFVVSNRWTGEWIEMIKCNLALYILDNMVRNIDKSLRAVQ